jgi:hypothetical protein
MKKVQKFYALGMGAMAFAYLATAIGTQVYVRANLLPEIDAGRDRVVRFESRILSDLKLLTDKPVFEKSARDRNAERFLTGFINWSGVDEIHSVEHDHLVESMGRHLDTLKSDENWNAFRGDEAIYDLDLAWVDQLSAYNSIDLTTHPRYTEILARAETSHGIQRVELANELPFPQFSELRYAALVRAAQLARAGDARGALTLFRHISDLLSTSDSLIGSMASVAMLHNEKKLAEYFSVDWIPIDDDRIDAMKRTAWMWPGLLRYQAATGSLGPFETYFHRETNACTWVHEAAGIELILNDYLQPTVVFEPNLNERLERERGVFLKALSACGHPELKVFYTPTESPLMIARGVPNPARIPFLRRVVGLNLVAIATPNYFRAYEKSPRSPASK